MAKHCCWPVTPLKEDVDPESGEVVRWLDITTVFENDPRSTTPRIKTLESHRQIPVSEGLSSALPALRRRASTYRCRTRFPTDHQGGGPAFSAEALSKVFRKLTDALAPEAIQSLFDRSGGKTNISPHDLRHLRHGQIHDVYGAEPRPRVGNPTDAGVLRMVSEVSHA